MNKVLIFGVDGFLGTHFVNRIISDPAYGQYHFFGSSRRGRDTVLSGQALLDVTDKNAIESYILEVRPDFIINLVGNNKSPDWDELVRINYDFSHSILKTVIKNNLNVKRIVFVGSAAEYGDAGEDLLTERSELKPINGYGFSKVLQSQISNYFQRVYGLKITIARVFNVLGPGMPQFLSIPSFIEKIKSSSEGTPVCFGNLDSIRDYLDVRDVCAGLWKLLTNEQVYFPIVNIASGSPIRMESLVKLIAQLLKKKLQVNVMNEGSSIHKLDIRKSVGSNFLLRREYGWSQEISLEASLREMIEST